tara:strand:+ start:299 stop:568 length:270 start_codon:yes stop_codon:yes gene_type:complete
MKTFKQFQEGLKTKLVVGGLLAAPFLAKKFLKPKTDKMLDKQRKTNKIGGDRRSGNTEFKQGVNAIKDAKKKGGLMNQSTRDALKYLNQ